MRLNHEDYRRLILVEKDNISAAYLINKSGLSKFTFGTDLDDSERSINIGEGNTLANYLSKSCTLNP